MRLSLQLPHTTTTTHPLKLYLAISQLPEIWACEDTFWSNLISSFLAFDLVSCHNCDLNWFFFVLNYGICPFIIFIKLWIRCFREILFNLFYLFAKIQHRNVLAMKIKYLSLSALSWSSTISTDSLVFNHSSSSSCIGKSAILASPRTLRNWDSRD